MTRFFTYIWFPFFVLSICIPLASLAKDKSKFDQIEQYLNSIKTLETDFIQIDQKGKVQTGNLKFKKPDKIRFEYDPPISNLVIVSAKLLVIIDRKSNLEPQRYLRSQTPIELVIGDQTSFIRRQFIKDFLLKKNKLVLVIANSEKPELGQIELTFRINPIELIEWVTVTFSGERTRLLLENPIINQPIDDMLFNIGNEITIFKKSISSK